MDIPQGLHKGSIHLDVAIGDGQVLRGKWNKQRQHLLPCSHRVCRPQRLSRRDAGNCSTFQVTLFILKDVLIGPGQLQTPLFFLLGCIGAADCCLQASQTGLSNHKPPEMIGNLKKWNFKDAHFLCMATFLFLSVRQEWGQSLSIDIRGGNSDNLVLSQLPGGRRGKTDLTAVRKLTDHVSQGYHGTGIQC